jgi:hypothetical protein
VDPPADQWRATPQRSHAYDYHPPNFLSPFRIANTDRLPDTEGDELDLALVVAKTSIAMTMDCGSRDASS